MISEPQKAQAGQADSRSRTAAADHRHLHISQRGAVQSNQELHELIALQAADAARRVTQLEVHYFDRSKHLK